MASDRQNLFWTLAHMGLGFLCTFTPFALIIWFYLILFTNFFKANRLLKKRKPTFFFILFSYLISFELLDRMAKASPFIPYEIGKYFLVLSGILGLLAYGIRQPTGILMALLVTPALFYDFSDQRTYFDIINNYLAPLAVGLGIAYAHKLSLTNTQLNQILKLIWWGCLSSLFYTYIKTPDFETITFSLKAQFDTTAGHASNQVSTVLGLGMFLSFYSIFNKFNFSGNRILDIMIFVGFTFQGLLSFSRGGMVVGTVGIFILLFLSDSNVLSNGKGLTIQRLFIVIVALLCLYGIFEIANGITGGNLLLRYKGETAGTLSGSKEVTADHFVTGRLSIFEQDVELWFENIVTGVGVGSSRFLRDLERVGISPHVELSRLLAEHGLLGLIYSCYFFLFIPLGIYQMNQRSNQRVVMMAILAIAILTTFHAAMRTFVTPLFVILSSLQVTSDLKENKPTRNI